MVHIFRLNVHKFPSALYFNPNTYNKTLTDNIFSNNIDNGLISQNITITTSDHYAWFVLKKDIKLQQTNQNLFQHNFKNFNDAIISMMLRTKNSDWNTILKADKQDIDISFNKFC